MPNTIYVGYDPREQEAYDTLIYSINKHKSNTPVDIIPLKRDLMEDSDYYWRTYSKVNGQCYDDTDGKPFSTEFSFTRFLIPHIHEKGYALFMDCDMYLRTNINELFDIHIDPTKAVHVVKHDYNPALGKKMDNQLQENYNRKNWSSFVLWNCDHPAHKSLTLADVNTNSGSWLHNFSWLKDYEIGDLDESWNWLDRWSSDSIEAKNVHFTTGGPYFPDWSPKSVSDAHYAEEWIKLNNERKDNA